MYRDAIRRKSVRKSANYMNLSLSSVCLNYFDSAIDVDASKFSGKDRKKCQTSLGNREDQRFSHVQDGRHLFSGEMNTRKTLIFSL